MKKTSLYSRPSQSSTDPFFGVEQNGISPIDTSERHGRPSELFWVWVAADIAIFNVIYGAIFFSAGLNLLQSALIAILGTAASFAVLALISLAGVRTGMPTMTISRVPFGPLGNVGPTLVGWINLLGWNIVAVVLVVYALLDVLQIVGVSTSVPWMALCLILVLLLLVWLARLGHATVVWVSTVVSILLGVLSVVIGGFLIARRVQWTAVLSAPPGDWRVVVAMASLVVIGTGFTYITIAADWPRYLPRGSSSRGVIGWTISGATIPIVGLILIGFLLSSTVPGLSNAADPVAIIRNALPPWLAIPYLLTVVGGLLVGCVITLYSSGLALLTMGVPWPRSRTVWIDGGVVLVGSAYVLFLSAGFLSVFENFLQLIAVGLLPWCTVFLADMLWRHGVYPQMQVAFPGAGPLSRRSVRWAALATWAGGIVVGFLCIRLPAPISSLSYLIGGLLSGGLYLALHAFMHARQSLSINEHVPVGPEERSVEG